MYLNQNKVKMAVLWFMLPTYLSTTSLLSITCNDGVSESLNSNLTDFTESTDIITAQPPPSVYAKAFVKRTEVLMFLRVCYSR